MHTYPTTIDNGNGERLTFLGRFMKDNIEYLEVENQIGPGSGPPMHVHYLQDERLTVLAGKLAMQCPGEEPRHLGPGETATFHRGQAHRFWNAGDTPLACRGQIWPAHNIEYFLTEIYRSVKSGQNGRPAVFDAAYLLNRYATEFDMLDIPFIVKKLIFPVVLLVGKLRGLHKKFIDAPIPAK